MLIEDFNRTIDTWIKELYQYDFAELCAKPSANSWSLGQVYMHLIDSTLYFLEEAEACTCTNENEFEASSPSAKIMFQNNSFPDMEIEGPPSNATTTQPVGKEQLINDLKKLKEEVNRVSQLISASTFRGKTKHIGLNYFCAREWMQFAEMHFRHHFRQKKRIDEFLKERCA